MSLEVKELMDFEDFIAYVKEHILDIGDIPKSTAKVVIDEVTKNNNKVITTLGIFKPGLSMSPSIVLEEHYEDYRQGRSIKDCILDMLEIYNEYNPAEVIGDILFENYEEAKDMIIPKLISKNRNEKMLKKLPYFEFGDLALIFQVLSLTKYGLGGITITRELLKNWGISQDTVLEQTMQNMQSHDNYYIASFMDHARAIRGLSAFPYGIPETVEENETYVLTNDLNHNGAAGLLRLDMIQEFADRAGQNIYIVPMSVSECILIPEYTHVNVNILRQNLRNLNRNNPNREDVLSSSIYYYNRNSHELTEANGNLKMVLKRGEETVNEAAC